MAMPNEATDALIDLSCRELRLPGIRSSDAAVVRDALAQSQSDPAFLAACSAQERDARRLHRLEAPLHQARFPSLKTLDQFNFLALPDLPKPKVLALADGAFIRALENVVCLGQPRTGKTHLATA